MSQKGNIALVPLIIILLLIVAGVAYFIGSKGNIKNPTAKQEVRLNTQYLNPFEKETHYVNPFDEYKNPFDVVGAEGHE